MGTVNERIIMMIINTYGHKTTTIGIYAPSEAKLIQEKDKFD